VFLLFFKYISYNEINTIEDLKKLLPEKVSILGAIPLMKKQMEFSKLVVQDSKRSGIAEAMRNLRTNMSFINKDARTIAISSSISGEGKTFVALNLAGIIAMTGKTTVIIDLDMRKPKIHLGFGASNLKGMSTILTDQTTLAECVQKSTLENLSFITAGITPPNPSELILSKKFNEIIEELKTQFDVIVIDNPPIGIVSDGVNVLAEADIPIYIFKAHYSKRIFTRRVNELMEMQHLKKLNVILNGMPMTKAGYGYGYGYGQGYGYGYYDEEEGPKSLLKRIMKK
jgi:tyrosine-protein kinase Etk/Wzc